MKKITASVNKTDSFSRNLSSINHLKLDKLFILTNNYNKAILLDKLIFWWQISTYTLEDGNIWFTRSINQISLDSKIAKRSVERYLCEFTQLGFIEKTNVLFRKKNLYIRITNKLLMLLGDEEEITNINDIEEAAHESNLNTSDLFLNHDGGINHANLAVSLYKEEDNNLNINNTVNQSLNVNKIPQTKFPIYAIEEKIGARISPTLKNYVKSTLYNLKNQHQVKLSNPEQVFSEVIFSLINKHHFVGLTDNKHKINIIAKLLRENRWKTPKGFYNHWDIGGLYRQKQMEKDRNAQKYKDANKYEKSKLTHNFSNNEILKSYINEQKEIINLLNSETNYLKQMKERLTHDTSTLTKGIINSTENKIARLKLKADSLQKIINQKKVA